MFLLGCSFSNAQPSRMYVQKYSTSLNEWSNLPDLQHAIDSNYPCFLRGNTIHIYNPSGAFQESYSLRQRKRLEEMRGSQIWTVFILSLVSFLLLLNA